MLLLQVFFVIRLQSQQNAANLPSIHDPDPHMSCELMDGRDNLLTLARDRHYEFSSLRRAKYSSIALLYELHNQGKESFVYTCNTCEAQVETRWHCSVCTVVAFCSILLTRYTIRPISVHEGRLSIILRCTFCISEV